jgi:hypothetical protein
LLSQGQPFAAQATISAILAGALLTRNNRVWLFAVVLSLSELVGVLVSVYLLVPALPLPAIDEQVWFMTKIVAACAGLRAEIETVRVLGFGPSMLRWAIEEARQRLRVSTATEN